MLKWMLPLEFFTLNTVFHKCLPLVVTSERINSNRYLLTLSSLFSNTRHRKLKKCEHVLLSGRHTGFSLSPSPPAVVKRRGPQAVLFSSFAQATFNPKDNSKTQYRVRVSLCWVRKQFGSPTNGLCF